MIEGEIAAFVTQFGMAGLIAWMWLSERRSSATREAQLSEAHTRIMDRQVQVESLMDLVAENTRAVSSLESSQRTIGQLLDRVLGADGDRRLGSGTLGG
jgi:hypothetical protein